MATLAPYIGGAHQRGPQLSPLTATAPMPRRYGPDTAGRPAVLDPRTGQSVCTSPGLDGRVAGPTAAAAAAAAALLHPTAAPTAALHHRAPTAGLYGPATDKAYAQYTLDPSLYYPSAMAAGRAVCYPYELSTMQYPYYGDGYGAMDLNGARRKNATRETTSTLKAWLYEHRKNPYPTKGEKIMLAIITKMTLTQVSTWFANARRRLKKENKMTWSPRNRCGDDRKDDYESEEGEEDPDPDREDDMDGLGTDLDSNHNGQDTEIDQDSDNRAWNLSLPDHSDKLGLSESCRERLAGRTPPGCHGSDSGRDSLLSVTDDDEEDEEDRRRHRVSPASPRPVGERCCSADASPGDAVCHRRRPISPVPPMPLLPSAIRPTCRPTSRGGGGGGGSRSPPCEKVAPLPVRPTEKPKIWSLAETALSKSPERRPQQQLPPPPPQQQQQQQQQQHQQRAGQQLGAVPQHRYHPYNSHPCGAAVPTVHRRLAVGHHPQQTKHQQQHQHQQHEAVLVSAARAGHFSTAPVIVQRPLLPSLQYHHEKGAAVQAS